MAMGLHGFVLDFTGEQVPEAVQLRAYDWFTSTLYTRGLPGAFTLVLGGQGDAFLKHMRQSLDDVGANNWDVFHLGA